ncbi:phage recombination protein Bet [Methylocaldum szegediense]|jgi:phage recombination protein Bet|uniref:phage recombination protein Bet n=1 Tax=Methylocaldum szegediense TaxID=73780 RepID=UPI0009FBD0CC|nr:phage recombination protein Bet [Methylocaldum szegediense]
MKLETSARLPMPVDAANMQDLDVQTWRILTDILFPTAKTPEAILMAWEYCKVRGLDIFKKPVHIVPMWNSALQRNVETVWPSIQEVQSTAARTKAWAGMDPPKWGPERTQKFCGRVKTDDDKWEDVEVTLTFPEWCEVTVYRLVGGKRCAFSEPVFWLEAYSRAGGKNSEVPTTMWIKRPRGQLHKCAKAASLRAAFPEECGEYVAEEMDGKIIDLEAAPIIEGTVTRVEEEPSETELPVDQPKTETVDPSQISDKVKEVTETLIARARAKNAWPAAFDWANTHFKGSELTYVMTELKKASQNGSASVSEGTPQAAFRQARESLGATNRARRTA